MAALIRRRLTPQVAHAAMLGGRRFGGEEAATLAIVEAAEPEQRVVAGALERARALAGAGNRQRAIVAAIKRELYGDVVAALAESRLARELLPEALQAPAA